MSNPRIWLLSLVPAIPFGGLITSIFLLSLLLPLFYQGRTSGAEDNPPALFFGLIIAYIIPVFSYITERCKEALAELRPVLDLNGQAYELALHQLESASLGRIVAWLCLGALSGFAHMSFIRGSIAETFTSAYSNLAAFLSVLGATMVWMIMTTVVAMLIQQASLFCRLAVDHVKVSIFSVHQMYPFSRVAISSSLAVIGALALFPLVGIENGENIGDSVPGALAMLVPLVIMFIIPIWPIHRRLVALKQKELTLVDKNIEQGLQGHDSPLNLDASLQGELMLLLAYRQEISKISTWPTDLGNLTRLALYLVIVPLTWAGAALIENIVDSFL